MTELDRMLSDAAAGVRDVPTSNSRLRLRRKLLTFWRLADDLAALSTCRRLSVGCVIVTRDLLEVAAIGYNGQPRQLPNDGCREEEVGSCGCVHAEASALVKLRVREPGLLLLTTASPCETCAGLILNSGRIGTVVYGSRYRDETGLNILSGRPALTVIRASDLIGALT